MYRLVKRAFDFAASAFVFLLISPFFLVLMILVRINLGSPIIFKQERPGKDGKIFTLYKFRSMTDARDENGNLLPNSVRLTKFGKILRKTSLDELPEAFNILFGHMSIIGPRPLLPEYLPYYTEEESHRHDVRPGLSGLAQVNGRNNMSWEQKFAYDIEYVNNITFLGDLKILYMSVVKAVKMADIQKEKNTYPGFLESRRDNVVVEQQAETVEV